MNNLNIAILLFIFCLGIYLKMMGFLDDLEITFSGGLAYVVLWILAYFVLTAIWEIVTGILGK